MLFLVQEIGGTDVGVFDSLEVIETKINAMRIKNNLEPIKLEPCIKDERLASMWWEKDSEHGTGESWGDAQSEWFKMVETFRDDTGHGVNTYVIRPMILNQF